MTEAIHDNEKNNNIIGDDALEDLQKLKKDLANLNEYFEKQELNKGLNLLDDSKKNSRTNILEMKKKEKEEKIKKYNSKKYKAPIIKKENFEMYLKNSLFKHDFQRIDLNIFNYKTLKEIFTCVGSYPSHTRRYIWAYLLSLPNDQELFRIYSLKGIHPFYQNLKELYPIEDQKYFRRLQIICSLLAFWCPHIGNIYYLPNIVFPFIKSLNCEDIFIFETLIALINSICYNWVEFYPNLPLKLLDFCCEVINGETNNQLDELCKCFDISLREIIWRLLSNFLSESFKDDDWLSLFDFLITYNHKPEMIIYFAMNFIISLQKQLYLARHDYKKFIQLLFDINYKRDMKQLFSNTLSLFKKYHSTQKIDFIAHIPFIENQYPVMDTFNLDFLKTTEQLKEELTSGKLDIHEDDALHEKNKKILENKYNELAVKERQIGYCYNSILETQKKKSEILKYELNMLLATKQKTLAEIKSSK